MKLEQICVSKELSIKLEEAGYPQNTYFNWMSENWSNDDWEDRIEANDYDYDCPNKVIASAPTVAELGEELPKGVTTDKSDHGGWFCMPDRFYVKIMIDNQEIYNITHSSSEANARAKMWLYLKKEELL